jgi:hypothetical protein
VRPLRLLLAASLVTALVAVPASTSAADTSKAACSSAVLVLRTLHIEAVPSKTKVHPGEKFPVEVTVTRPAHEDPVGQGIEFEPPASVPAADVTVGLSVYVGERTYFWQVGKTDEEGKATLMLTVPQNSEFGWALAMASARYWVKSDCPDILEDGYTTYPEFVKVVP